MCFTNLLRVSTAIMNYYILQYQLHKDYLAKRASHRSDHFDLVKSFKESDELLMGGAINEHTEAYIIFKCNSQKRVEDFVNQDPYIKHGVATHWEIKPWNMVTDGI